MYKPKILTYKNKSVRTFNIENKIWWSILDVCDVIGRKNNNVLASLSYDEKKCIVTCNPNPKSLGALRLSVMDTSTLLRVIRRIYSPETTEFERWVIQNSKSYETLTDLPLAEKPKVPTTAKTETEKPKTQTVVKSVKSSAEAGLQKAAMLIRIAEHKAIPKEEQLRLLDEATRELLGMGLNLKPIETAVSKIVKLKTISIKTGLAVPAFEPEIMNLPEVVGHTKITSFQRNIEGRIIYFDSIRILAPSYKTSIKNFNAIMDDLGLKNPFTGCWYISEMGKEKVREFFYIEETIRPYLDDIISVGKNFK